MVTTDKVTVTEFAPYIGKTTTDYKENDMELISRKEAVKKLGDDHFKNYGNAIMIILDLPTVEERKEGRWIDTDYINLQLDTYLASCSECGYQMDVHNNRGYFKYCPNCGAKMYEDDKDIYVPNKGE